MQIIYDTPIEVTRDQYNIIMNHAKGICAGREADGKYYVKLWWVRDRKVIKKILENVK